ncbi:MAG TPA: META domain-containing protein [Anaerolineae bacterium]|nr:META domain-containing protein [Anaerolineae bacterium]
MRKRGLLVGLALLVVLPLSSCGTSVEINLDGTAWELTSMGGDPLIPGSRITLAFEGGEVEGSAGCNRYFGTYTLSGGGGFQVSEWAITEMACLSPEGVMSQETTYMGHLSTACRVVLEGDELKLQDGSGRDLLIFVAATE